MLIDWKTFLEQSLIAMRENLFMEEAISPGSLRLQELRTIHLKGARQTGKSTAIMHYVRENDCCVIYDRFTKTLYSGMQSPANGQRNIVALRNGVDPEEAFKDIVSIQARTLFIDCQGTDLAARFAKFYQENEKDFLHDFMLVVES